MGVLDGDIFVTKKAEAKRQGGKRRMWIGQRQRIKQEVRSVLTRANLLFTRDCTTEQSHLNFMFCFAGPLIREMI